MKKFEWKNIVIVLLIVIVIGLIVYDSRNKLPKNGANFLGMESDTVELSKDIDFYKYLSIYKSLLPDDQFKVVDDRGNKVSEEVDKEDSKIQNIIVLTLMKEFMNDEKAKKIVLELKDKISNQIENSKIDKDTLFTKNTECAKLTNNIKDGLAKKYESTSYVTEKEELNFIFYSPTLNACIYTTDYDYSYYHYYSSKSESYSRSSHKIYNVSSDKQLGDYPSYYSSDYPYTTGEKSSMEIKKGVTNYKKFILENSGYNAKLLKDVNF